MDDRVLHPVARGEPGVTQPFSTSSFSPERNVTMDSFVDFISSWYFFGICLVLLAALIGLLLFLRNRRTDD
jgi:hypothetical protein